MTLKSPYFTLNQLKCIEYMALGSWTQVAIASELEINPMTITRWKKDPKFMHAVVMKSRANLKEDLPAVYNSLSSSSKDGSAQHIKILLDHLESLEKAHSNQASVTFVWKQDDSEQHTVVSHS